MQVNKENLVKIDNEQVRYYRFPQQEVVSIQEPVNLVIAQDGHYIDDNKGISYFIPYGWLTMYWVDKKEEQE